jgi:hypothetical protein
MAMMTTRKPKPTLMKPTAPAMPTAPNNGLMTATAAPATAKTAPVTPRPPNPAAPATTPAPVATPAAPQTKPTPAAAPAAPVTPRNGLGAAPGDPTYTGYQDSTAVLVNDMAQQDSLLMQQAATSGLQTANDRGMVNSSMAAGASQAATLDYIVPIASQDAAQNFNKNMSGLEQRQNLQMAKFDRNTQQTLQKTQIMADSMEAQLDRELALQQQASDQGFEAGQTQVQLEFQTAQLASQQAFEAQQLAAQQAFQASLDQSSQDFEQQMAEFEAQQLEEQREFEAQQAELDRQIQTALAEMDLGETDQAAATAMMTDAWSDYNQMYAQILANPDLSAEERQAQIQTNQEMLDDRITYTTELYGVAFDWPENPWDV